VGRRRAESAVLSRSRRRQTSAAHAAAAKSELRGDHGREAARQLHPPDPPSGAAPFDDPKSPSPPPGPPSKSPAAAAPPSWLHGISQTPNGIVLGDVIVAVDGVKVDDCDDLFNAIDTRKSGERVSVDVQRGESVVAVKGVEVVEL
jgi:S1-C subfamily serine protease